MVALLNVVAPVTFFVIRLYRGRMTKKACVIGFVTQGCGCCAAFPWAIIFRAYSALE
jgi:hypothetical protein